MRTIGQEKNRMRMMNNQSLRNIIKNTEGVSEKKEIYDFALLTLQTRGVKIN